MSSPQPPTHLCARCRSSPGTITGRNDHLCKYALTTMQHSIVTLYTDNSMPISTCFLAYVRSKPIKRMDPFRVRNTPSNDPPPLLLLPFSFGVSSLALLHTLSDQMASQLVRVGRTGYELLVVWIDDCGVVGNEERSQQCRELFNGLKQRYARGGIEDRESVRFLAVPLEEIYSYGRSCAGSDGVDTTLHEPPPCNLHKLRTLISSISTLSSKQDILYILLTRLLNLVALKHHCHAILYSHSITRLAEMTLSETAKGRGFSVPWATGDCTLPPITMHARLAFNLQSVYPLRDLLYKELVTYIITLGLSQFLYPGTIPTPTTVTHTPIPTRTTSTTIDSLIHAYFSTMEHSYPSIVANVVKTSNRVPSAKLPVISSSIPPSPFSTSEGEHTLLNCAVCGFPIDMEEDPVWEGEDAAGSISSQNILKELQVKIDELCGGCKRTWEGGKGGVEAMWPV